MKRYGWNVLLGLDYFFNALFGGAPDETISSRLGKQVSTCRFCKIACRVLHNIDRDHCEKSIQPDRGKPLQDALPG